MNHNSTTPVYTPLESLFLFQLLSRYGFANDAFHRISEELRANVLIREQPSYDAGRLGPEPLQELSLQLLRGEQKRQALAAEKNGGGLSPTSRKRKLPSPPLPSLREAHEHYEKLPILVNGLYARYREGIIREINEDEQRIHTLQREITEIERGEWDGRIARDARGPPASSGSVPVEDARAARVNGQPPVTPVPAPAYPPDVARRAFSTPTAAPPPLDKKGVPPTPPLVPPSVQTTGNSQQNAIDVRPADFARPTNGASPVLQHPQAAATNRPCRSPDIPQPPPRPDGLQRPDGLARPGSQTSTPVSSAQSPGPLQWEQPSHQPPRQQTPIPPPRHPFSNTASVRQAGHAVQTSPGPPHPPIYPGNRRPPSPCAPPPRVATPGSKPSPQPVLVPPQNAGPIPPSLQSLPPNATPDGAGKQPQPTGPPSVQPGTADVPVQPTPSRPSQAQPLPAETPIRPPVGFAATATSPITTSASRGSAGQGLRGSNLVPSANIPSSPAPAAPAPPLVEDAMRRHSSPYDAQAERPGSSDQAQGSQAPGSAPHTERLPPHTPFTANIASHVIRGHGTKWTSTPTPATPSVDAMTDSPDQSPAYEALSPVLQPAQLSSARRPMPRKDSRHGLQKLDTSGTRGRGRPPRITKTPSGAPEAGGALGEPETPARQIKNEAATPRTLDEKGATTPADGSVQSRVSSAAPRTTDKGQRQDSSEPGGVPAPATHVLWTRSFNKVSASALEQVTSHRDANLFANPVRDRDAPGYGDIVLLPQDLRKIRTAIQAGNKAATAVAATLADLDPTAVNVWLPISVELVPPRGIINIAQLERELVRMFSNAIMYAPDPDRGLGRAFIKGGDDARSETEDILGYKVDEDGIVKDTRNMFMEVEKLLGDLRNEVERNAPRPMGAPAAAAGQNLSLAGAEASTAEDDVDELAGDGDAPSTAKRRRVRG